MSDMPCDDPIFTVQTLHDEVLYSNLVGLEYKQNFESGSLNTIGIELLLTLGILPTEMNTFES